MAIGEAAEAAVVVHEALRVIHQSRSADFSRLARRGCLRFAWGESRGGPRELRPELARIEYQPRREYGSVAEAKKADAPVVPVVKPPTP